MTAKASAAKKAKALERKKGIVKKRKSRKGFLGDTFEYDKISDVLDDAIFLTEITNNFQITVFYLDTDGEALLDYGVSFTADSVDKFIMAVEAIYKTLLNKYNFSEVEKIEIITKEVIN